MTFGTALYTLLLKPLQLIFETIYNAAYQNIKNPGLSIIALSLAINFLVLPLYRRADALQQEERDTELKLDRWVRHIKKTFRGDERTMMLQTYYRQNNYSPFYVLRSAVSLFLEIPFFIAAYRFLSGLELLEGVSFGPIADLSKPDALLTMGALSINLLPIIMTVVNIISSAIFSKGYPLKTKIQLYGMAAFFLVFLYNSPAGLVFYWTLNNLFSLIKTIFYKIKHPRLVLSILSLLFGEVVLFWAAQFFLAGTRRKAMFFGFCGLLLFLPLILFFVKKSGKRTVALPTLQPSTKRFVLAALFLAVLTGLLIPSAVLKASPQEFMDIRYFVHPLWYLAHSFLLSTGMFVLWFGVFYWLASKKARPIFECVMWAFCGVAVVDYLFFGTNMGTMSSNLVFDQEIWYSLSQVAINGIVVLAVVGVLAFVFWKWQRIVSKVLVVALAAFVCMSAINAVQIRHSVAAIDLKSLQAEDTADAAPSFTLSKTGKNVVVIMIDRAMGEYVPYIFNEKPELKEQFDGFTYYSNTVSFGGHTNFATPALFGGYEYTPVELNKRDKESLEDKQNEALKMMPVLFDAEGYDVTVFDPPYAGYQEIPDLSIYDEYKNIRAYNTNGYFTSGEAKETQVKVRNRNFFCYGLTKIAPVFAQNFLYGKGQYNQVSSADEQVIESTSKAYGTNSEFMKSYYVLQNMSDMTHITESKNGSFLLMENDLTHCSAILSEPEYLPEITVDNTAYDEAHSDRFTLDGRTLKMESTSDYSAYHSNAAAMVQMGAWFEYLRENGVYDNTKIILVSDHGFATTQLENFVFDSSDYRRKIDERLSDAEFFYPLLMVKDFNATGFTTSDEFMTNADVPTLAVSDVIENAKNPLTGKAITNTEKTAHAQYIIASSDFNVDKNNGNTFLPARWWSVHDSIWEKDNWTLVAENAVLPQDGMP